MLEVLRLPMACTGTPSTAALLSVVYVFPRLTVKQEQIKKGGVATYRVLCASSRYLVAGEVQ